MLRFNRKTGHYTGKIGYTKTTSKKKDSAGSVFFVSKQSYDLLLQAIELTSGDVNDKQALVFYPLTKTGKVNKRFWDENFGFSPLRGEAVD